MTVMGKGISSVYFPVFAVGLHRRIGEVVAEDEGEFFHGYTNSCHPVGAAAVIKNIEIIQQEGLVEHVRETLAPAMWEGLHELAGWLMRPVEPWTERLRKWDGHDRISCPVLAGDR